LLFVCGIGNCGSCIVIEIVATITDLECFEDIAESLRCMIDLIREIMFLELPDVFVHFSAVFYFTTVTLM
jgi:hypothetical protein